MKKPKLKLELLFPKEGKKLSHKFLEKIKGGNDEENNGNYSSTTPVYSYSSEVGRDIERAKEN